MFRLQSKTNRAPWIAARRAAENSGKSRNGEVREIASNCVKLSGELEGTRLRLDGLQGTRSYRRQPVSAAGSGATSGERHDVRDANSRDRAADVRKARL